MFCCQITMSKKYLQSQVYFSYSHNIQDIKIKYILFLNEKGNCMYITECCFAIKEWNPIVCANKPVIGNHYGK